MAGEVARAPTGKAHAPYSNFLVGSALKVKGKDLYVPGCNVENASFGGTVCAERTSVFSSIAAGEKEFEFIVIVTSTEPASPPCGFCRQVLSEFCDKDFPVYLANLKKIEKMMTLGELLPEMFDKSKL